MKSRLDKIAKRFIEEAKNNPDGLTKREWLEQRFKLADKMFIKITGTELDSKIWGLVMHLAVLDDLVLQTPKGEK